MKRREFIVSVALLANVGLARAQDRVRRVGALITEPATKKFLETFERPLCAAQAGLGNNGSGGGALLPL